jgi:hypothetical protein
MIVLCVGASLVKPNLNNNFLMFLTNLSDEGVWIVISLYHCLSLVWNIFLVMVNILLP